MTGRRFTVVSFHAHPDDEALLTGGTLARAAAEGHRVVLVVATLGEAGLAELPDARTGPSLGATRRAELAASARAIGAERVELLGYADSGMVGGSEPAPAGRRSRAVGPPTPARGERLARILREERGRRAHDLRRQRRIRPPRPRAGPPGRPRAASLAGTPVVLEATVDRGLLLTAVGWLRRLGWLLPLPQLPDLGRAFTDRAELTHRVDVRRTLDAKRRSLRAHASQATGDGGARTVALLLRLPWPVRGRVLGHEWFREIGRTPTTPLLDDIFASLG